MTLTHALLFYLAAHAANRSVFHYWTGGILSHTAETVVCAAVAPQVAMSACAARLYQQIPPDASGQREEALVLFRSVSMDESIFEIMTFSSSQLLKCLFKKF